MGEDGAISLSNRKSYMGLNGTSTQFRCYYASSSYKVYLFKETDEADAPSDSDPVVVTPPEISLPAGTYAGEQQVTITAADGLTIYYSLNASVAGDAFQRYEEVITISSSSILQAYTQDADGNRSEIVSVSYTIGGEAVGPDPDPEPDDPMADIIADASTPAVWVRRFYESFDKNDGLGGNDGKWSGTLWNELVSGTSTAKTLPESSVDMPGWQISQGAASKGSQCLVFRGRRDGNNYYSGELTSPALGFSGNGLLRFKVAAWNTNAEKTGLTLSFSTVLTTARFIVDGEEVQKYEVPGIVKGEFVTVELLLTDVEESTRLCFSTPEERSDNPTTRTFIDEVEVYELYSAGGGVEWDTGEESLMSGSWTSTELAAVLGVADWDVESATGLDLRAIGARLAENFTVDNSGGNPNLLVFSDSGITVENGINVAGGILSQPAALTDLRDFSLAEAVSGEVSYARLFSGVGADDAGGWSVLCLPFAVETVTDGEGNEYIPYAEWMETQSADVGFYWLKVSTEEKNAINTDATSIEANVPYLIAFPNYGYEEYPLLNVGENVEFTFSGSEGLVATTGLTPTAMPQWEFWANYKTAEEVGTYRYVLNDAGLAFENDGALQPFRPYVAYTDTVGILNAPLRFLISDANTPSRLMELVFPDKQASLLQVETREGGIRLTASGEVRAVVYTIDGLLLHEFLLQSGETRVVSLLSGIYIVNKQKIVVSKN